MQAKISRKLKVHKVESNEFCFAKFVQTLYFTNFQLSTLQTLQTL